MHPIRNGEISALLEQGLLDGAFPAAQACVISKGSLIHSSAHGFDHLGKLTTETSLFDVASVTKLSATTIASAILIARRQFSLATKVVDILPGFHDSAKAPVVIRDLLAHSSGLPAWEPLFVRSQEHHEAKSIFPNLGQAYRDFASSRDLVHKALLDIPLTRTGGYRVYSDLGFILLGHLLEVSTGASLNHLCTELIYEPLGLGRIGFNELEPSVSSPFAASSHHILPTGSTRPREPAPGQESLYRVHEQESHTIPGEVDDDNSYALGGVAGHAGLFATACDLGWLGWAIVEEINGAERLGASEVLRGFARPDLLTQGAPRGLGFDIPCGEGSLAGSMFGQSGPLGGIGHLGFTGCSLWMDLDRQLVVSLLTNRVFPTRKNVERMRRFRPSFHNEVIKIVA